MTLAAGSRLGPYAIVAPLGAGGMGEVYRAKDPRLGREVAIKVLPAEVASDPERLRRFEQEARAASALNHPNILTVHDVGSENGTSYLVTELLQGESLRELVRKGPLPPKRAVELALQLAKGLAAAHEKGIVHRDLKPENLFLTGDGVVKILDFGLARLAAPIVTASQLARAPTLEALTGAGMVIGTVGYMAPEQVRGETADARSDLFAFGCVLYELLAGQRAFARDSAVDTLHAILHDEPPELDALASTAPPALADVLRHCLDKRREKRFQSAADLVFALEHVDSAAAFVPPTRPGAKSAPPEGVRWRQLLRWHPWLAFGISVAAILAVLLALDAGGLRGRSAERAVAPRAIRMAVLPFANLSGDPEQEYLSDGVTQEMIAQLGRLHPESLSVIARTSVLRYKNNDTPIDQIGHELSVDYVLEGSAQREANRIRISAVLIQVRDQTQLWAESYERELASILALQRDVAQKVAGALALELLPAEQARLTQVRTVDPEAYEAFLKGRFYLNKMTEEGFEKGLAYLHQAVAKDPENPLPYAALALGYSLIGHERHPDAFEQARAAARKAEELGGEPLAEMYLAFGMIKLCSDFDYDGAESDLRRALELDPSIGEAHRWYSWYLLLIGQRDEALARMKRAQEAEPLTPLFSADRGWQYWWLGHYDEALEETRKSLELDPNFNEALHVLGAVLAEQGRFAEAIAAHEKLSAVDPDWRWSVTRTLAQAGRKDEARSRLAQFSAEEPKPTGGWAGWFLAETYAELGETDEAFRWLEEAYREKHSFMPWINANRAFAPLRSDPRFQDLARRLRLPA